MSTALPSKDATLEELQAYVKAITVERGFDTNTVAQRFMMLVEEVGELARAARKSAGITFAADTHRAELEHEAADVFVLLLGLCDMLGISLADAFRIKETLNRKRKWQ